MALEQYVYNPLLVGVLVIIFTWLIIYFWNSNRKLPPGPWGLPFIGYYPYISDRPHEDFLKLSKKYGNVFSFRTLGGRLIIILNGTKVIKDVLINRADEFIGRPYGNNVITLMSDGIGITQEDGMPWKEQRRFFLHNLKNFGVGKAEMENHIADEVQSMLKILRKNTGRSTQILAHLAYATNSIVSRIIFNTKIDRNDPRMSKILRCGQGLRELFIGRTNYLVGWIQDLYAAISPTQRKAIKDRDYVREITDAFIDERLKSFYPDHIRDCVDVYLFKRNELLKSGKLNESSFSMERLRAISFNLYFEGMESVSTAVMGMLAELSKHLNAQREAQKEMDNVVGRERLPSWSDRLNLPYLDATIQELYRFAAPFLITTQYSNFG
ncbi:Cytochrome P450 2A3, partial [Stegodyphus mimosarum]